MLSYSVPVPNYLPVTKFNKKTRITNIVYSPANTLLNKIIIFQLQNPYGDGRVKAHFIVMRQYIGIFFLSRRPGQYLDLHFNYLLSVSESILRFKATVLCYGLIMFVAFT